MSSFVDIASLWTCTRYILRKKIEFLAQTQIFTLISLQKLCLWAAENERRTTLFFGRTTNDVTINYYFFRPHHFFVWDIEAQFNTKRNIPHFSSGPHIFFVRTTYIFRPDHTYVSSGPHIFFIWNSHNFRPDHTYFSSGPHIIFVRTTHIFVIFLFYS